MDYVLASSEVGLGVNSGWVKPTTMKLVFVTSPIERSIKKKEQKLVGSESG
jgi:hypothetical protein